MSTIKLENIQTRTGSGTITIGASGETVALGATTNNLLTPMFEVYRNGDQSLTDITEAKVQWNATNFDSDSVFDTSTNYRFTVPAGKAGKYHFYSLINVSAQAVSQLEQFYSTIRKNGSTGSGNQRVAYYYPMNNAGAQFSQSLSATFDLAVGDYVEMYVYVDDNSGSPVIDSYVYNGTAQASYFGGFRIG